MDVELLAAGERVDARGDQDRLGRLGRAGEAAQRAAQTLPAVREGRVHDREDLLPADTRLAGGSRRVQATRPESTLGAGQKTLRPIEPVRRTSAYQAALTDGMP